MTKTHPNAVDEYKANPTQNHHDENGVARSLARLRK
jgi:hypothetical protein